MNDIYKQKAEKYKYKYLKLKKEIEYIGEGGYLPNYFSEGGYLPNYFSEGAFNNKVDKLIEKYINIDFTNSQILIKINEDPDIKYSFNPVFENRFNYQVYNRIKEYIKKYPPETIETQNDKPDFFSLISEKGFNNQVDKRIKKYIEETKKKKELEAANKKKLEELEALKQEQQEQQDFKDKIQNVKKVIEKIIVPLYKQQNIIGNINKDEIFKSDYDGKINHQQPVQCYHNNLNEVSKSYTYIKKSKVIKILNDCKFKTLNNFLDHLLFSEQKQTDLNNNNNKNHNYDDDYIFNLNFLKKNIKIHNYDLYLLYDIIYDLYFSLNDKLKQKYNHLFNKKQYAETPYNLINLLDQILNIN
jgi:hypothetical protein